MAKLTEETKVFIVQALACFDSPTQVASAVKDQFGLMVDRRQVEAYDPTKVASKGMARKLRALFEQTREAFLKDASAIPIAKQTYRLRVLQRALDRADKSGNNVMVMQILEQAAKEIGGAFTNRRELTGRGGGPIIQAQQQVTAAELAAAVRSVREDY